MIALTRIDDRLIHGQVATQWVADSRANNIYIVDDETADDEFAVMVCKGLAPLRTEVHVLHTAESFDVLKEVAENDSKRGLIIVKTPEPLNEMLEHGVPLKKIVVGGMGKRADRKPLFKAISASNDEIELLKKMESEGVEVVVQIVPSDKAMPISKVAK